MAQLSYNNTLAFAMIASKTAYTLERLELRGDITTQSLLQFRPD